MKKRNYLSVGVKFFANDAIASVQIPENETESVAAQAEEHKDLRYHVTVNDVGSLVVIPWEKVAAVTITYDTTDVTAPTDAICGGGDVFEVKMLDEIPRSASKIIKSGDLMQVCTLIISPFAATESMSYNGEPVTNKQFYQALDAGKATLEIPGFEMNDDGDFARTIDCGVTSGEETVTMKFTYMGAATNVTATFPYSNGT